MGDRKAFWKVLGPDSEQWGWWRAGVSRQTCKNVSLGEELRTIDTHLGVTCRR